MNKKGYTLVELLAVLALMAAILLVAVPSIAKQFAGIEENNYTQFKQNIFLAAESYINSNPNAADVVTLKENGKTICIATENLIRGGWIKSTLTNPKTDKKLAEQTSSIQVKNENGEYKYTYFPTTSNCTK